MNTTSKNHVLPLPLYVSVIRAIQFVLGIVLLGLAGWGVSKLSYDGYSLTIFTALATMIATAYVLVSTKFSPIAYNYWAVLGLDIFLVIFWLVSFAVTASEARDYHLVSEVFDNCDDELDGYCGYYFKGSNSKTFRNVLIVTAIFGAFQFILFIVTLAFTGFFVQRHRSAGGHCIPAPPLANAEMSGPDATNRGYEAPPV